MSKRDAQGFRVVLVADRTLMARYEVLMEGMLSASQTTTVPALAMKGLLAPRVSSVEGLAERAPMGLRRVESALVSGGFAREEVAVVTPEGIARAVGTGTRIVGISSGDPLGRGMNSSTMRGLSGGRTYTETWFQKLAGKVRGLRPRDSGTKVVVGGAGAWQLVQDADARKRLGIDHVVTGYCEEEIAEVFGRICEDGEVGEVIECRGCGGPPPRILAPTVMGTVEIMRGCGLGCDFCTMAALPMEHVAADAIVADAEVNVRGGSGEISLIGEDVFRYGSKGPGTVNAEAFKGLLKRLRGIEGLKRMHVDHANISSVAQMSDADLEEIAGLLAGGGDRRYLWVNLGVESASPRLLEMNCGAKLRPYKAEDWAAVCMEQAKRLAGAGFMPMVSLLVGLPGEREEDVAATETWARRLRGMRVTAFPMFLAPTEAGSEGFGNKDMTKAHWRLFRECYRLNFKWIPRLVWANQRGTRTPTWRRLAIQGLGRCGGPVLGMKIAMKSMGKK